MEPNKLCQTVHSANTTQSYPNAVHLPPKWCPSVPSQQAIFRVPCRSLMRASKRLLTFTNSLSELVLQAANASFLCIAVRADVLLEVEKYLPSLSSDRVVKLSQNFCRQSTNGDEVSHGFLQQKRLSDTLHQKCSKELLRLILESGCFTITLSPETTDPETY